MNKNTILGILVIFRSLF